jgi:hypothetical protein
MWLSEMLDPRPFKQEALHIQQELLDQGWDDVDLDYTAREARHHGSIYIPKGNHFIITAKHNSGLTITITAEPESNYDPADDDPDIWWLVTTPGGSGENLASEVIKTAHRQLCVVTGWHRT